MWERNIKKVKKFHFLRTILCADYNTSGDNIEKIANCTVEFYPLTEQTR